MRKISAKSRRALAVPLLGSLLAHVCLAAVIVSVSGVGSQLVEQFDAGFVLLAAPRQADPPPPHAASVPPPPLPRRGTAGMPDPVEPEVIVLPQVHIEDLATLDPESLGEKADGPSEGQAPSRVAQPAGVGLRRIKRTSVLAPDPEPEPVAAVPAAVEPATPKGPPAAADAQARIDEHGANRPPAYPRDALAAGWKGTVLVRVDLDDHGTVLRAVVTHSSGHESLDQEALATVKSWAFLPARSNGVCIASSLEIPITFRLRN